jgi:hypothetical protein
MPSPNQRMRKVPAGKAGTAGDECKLFARIAPATRRGDDRRL